ncbi:hypothetical protein BH23GEM6_BH23GEM6_19120 [soil metagenome]
MTVKRSRSKTLVVTHGQPLQIRPDGKELTLRASGKAVRLTNLRKVFFPIPGVTKLDLLQYYADFSPG